MVAAMWIKMILPLSTLASREEEVDDFVQIRTICRGRRYYKLDKFLILYLHSNTSYIMA